MARVLRMPELAEDPTAGVLSEWLVEESGVFAGAQSLATVETEKLVVSVEVSEPGVLVKTLVPTGAQVDTGTPLAVLADPDETVADLDALLVELGLAEPVPVAVPEPAYAPRRVAAELRRAPDLDDPLVVAEPRTRSVAEVLGLNVAAPPLTTPSPVEDVEPHRVVTPTEVGPIAQLHLRETVRAEPLLAVLAEINSDAERVTLTDLVVKAVASAYDGAALGDARPIVDVAVAVPARTSGATPVVADVGSLTVTGVHAALTAATAREVADPPAPEQEPALITVVDLGSPGVAELAVDVTPDRRALLAVGGVRDEPVVEHGVLVPGKVLTVTFSIDQELADSRLAARWVEVLVELLEHPVRFLA
ncbi:2-oxo acid dehydrogenase subunit E2 [Nocardioides cynanchi]|uniref:2-oxo acid dehydrogenase subunit E2 n=1 Tax=Nocardioides cynanchi TaxID=2558918 RepID=UPI00124733AD|nr:2-oxo acid dehydrogenase subunit E2 [Nocardioides cynanchi]